MKSRQLCQFNEYLQTRNMKNSAKIIHSDRFIPSRSQSAPKNYFTNQLTQARELSNGRSNVLSNQSSSNKQLTLTQSMTTKQTTIRDFLKNTIAKSCISSSITPLISPQHQIVTQNIVDNYYYNTMDIAKNEFVALGIGSRLLMFRRKDETQMDLNSGDKRQILLTCVKYSHSDHLLFSGNQLGDTQAYDIDKSSLIRTFKSHRLRVGRIQNHPTEPHLMFTGSKDHEIKLNDLRIKKPVVDTFKSQCSQITGLCIKEFFMASGHNNGNVVIWDIRNKKQMTTLSNHQGAVKALSWCPWKQNTLVSGGGKQDTEIIIYNFLEQKIQAKIPSKHQISEICWRNSTHQMIYSESRSEVVKRVGRIHMSNYFNRRAKKVNFTDLGGRILGMKMNPNDDNVLINLSGDEQLSYWNISKTDVKINASDVLENFNNE